MLCVGGLVVGIAHVLPVGSYSFKNLFAYSTAPDFCFACLSHPSHQSSALNRLVAPVLSGNAKTLILQHLSPHRFFRPDSARTLGVGQKALNINTICRQLAVPIEDMRFLDSAVVLAPNKKQSQPAPQSERKSLESKTQQPRTPPKVRETETNSGDSDGDSQSNDLLMEALYSSPTDNNDAGLKPFQSPKMTQQQREELGIFVSDDGNSGAAVSGDEDAEHAHAEANEARGGDEKDEDDALSVGSVLKQQDRENVPVDESEAAENAARTAAAEDVQSRIAYIDRILSEVQSGQQSYSAEKNRLREEFNATIDKVVGRNENAASAVVPKIPQGSDPPRFARTAEHAWRREQEAAKQARAEEAWFRQQQEVELAASVARDAARGGVHSITAPVRTASAMDGHAEENRRPDASTGSAGWGATPPSHLRPNLTKRIEPPGRGSASHGQAGSLSERDPEEVGVSAAKGAVASVYERHMEKLERISRGPPKQTARANALVRRLSPVVLFMKCVHACAFETFGCFVLFYAGTPSTGATPPHHHEQYGTTYCLSRQCARVCWPFSHFPCMIFSADLNHCVFRVRLAAIGVTKSSCRTDS
eukprot:INCI14784.1.p1 GENE.INCI14784.1~~INCI14784.1.p1  ORF type:complete len:591 (+),score=86.46 INCI14784.1:1273-3045(+)